MGMWVGIVEAVMVEVKVCVVVPDAELVADLVVEAVLVPVMVGLCVRILVVVAVPLPVWVAVKDALMV